MKCLSFEAIVADKSLGFGDIEPTPEAIRRAIDAQLREMQSQSLDGTPDRYRALVDARRVVEELEGEGAAPRGGELVPVPAAILERLIKAVERQTPPRPMGPSATERMQTTKSAAVTKASQDFRNGRTRPLAGGSAIVAFLSQGEQQRGGRIRPFLSR